MLEAVGLELAVQLSEQILTVSEAVESAAERLSIAVRTFMNKARTDPDWTRALVTRWVCRLGRLNGLLKRRCVGG